MWTGPPPADLARRPEMLREMADAANADTVVIDSLKDAAMKLSDEETGQGVSRAMNHCVANGVEVLAYHHQRKSNGTGGKPKTLADMYGSAWIAAGAGSVVLLWGAAGDLVVDLDHLKQPAAEVGPLRLVHDHVHGITRLYEQVDILALLAHPRTVQEVAFALHNGDQPTGNGDVEKARRKLDRLVTDGRAVKLPAAPGRAGAYVRAAPEGGHGKGHG